ncbi:hypothetical protein LOTGIDRAFT_162263 [Lottia gigantea]|uniref:Uncharacterized protein n=1 Tax=Lottia gigantea TaxID=225164 RepID=V4AHB2_LOTGI|nr:hypothetical protein LOTGIDRAFT_162263 [Lottia gigantea]ESO92781.1 hypothetical protein LOTGIDRAFT_162263 [Lottia gigantea]
MPEVEVEIPGRRRRAVEPGLTQANSVDGLNQAFQNRMKRAITVNNVQGLLPFNDIPATNPQPLSRTKRFLGLDGGDGMGLGLGLLGIINDQMDRVRDRVNDRIDRRRERILDNIGNAIPDMGGLGLGLGLGGLGLGWGLGGGLGLLGGGLLDNCKYKVCLLFPALCTTIHQQNDNLNVFGIQTTEIELQQVNQIPPDAAPLRRKRALGWGSPFGFRNRRIRGILGGMNIGDPLAGAWGGGGEFGGWNGNGGGWDGGINAGVWDGNVGALGGNADVWDGNGGGWDGGVNVGAWDGNIGALGGNADVWDGNAGGWAQRRGFLAGGAGGNMDGQRNRDNQLRNLLQNDLNRQREQLNRMRDRMRNVMEQRRDRILDAMDRVRDRQNNLMDRRRDQMERMRERMRDQMDGGNN